MQFNFETIVFILSGMAGSYGYNVETEIIVNNGVRKECFQSFQQRFQETFVIEIQKFVNCILKQRKTNITVVDVTKSTIITELANQSFKLNKLIKL